MHRLIPFLLIHPLVLICSLTIRSADACQVPVFRYALEHWHPDPFEVVVLYRSELTEDQQTLVESLRAAAASDQESRANINVILLDAAQVDKAEEYEKQLIDQYGDGPLPKLLLYFPLTHLGPELVWSGEFTPASVATIVQSPARAEIAKRLLDGQSAVWVLLESGHPQKDDKAEEILRQELAGQKEKIHLPSLQELATEEKFNQEIDVQLRVEFSIVRISRDDPQESVFRGMLLASESDLKDFDEPIAIPIFGRGRSYFALIGEGINADTIEENCMFICGPCSCEAKRLNPGRDMLLTANWDQIIPRDWATDIPLPELTGIGAFETALGDQAEERIEPATEPVDDVSDQTVVAMISDSGQHDQHDMGQRDGSLGIASQSNTTEVSGTPHDDDAQQPGSLEGSLLSVLLGLGGIGLCVVICISLWLRASKQE